MPIASVIAASIRNRSRRRHSSSAAKPDKKAALLVNENSLSTQWLKQSPAGRLNHINTSLLKEIDTQIKQISKKELLEPELNKSYQALIQCVSHYQIEAKAIYSARKNSTSKNILLCAVFFALALTFCIPISVLYPPMLPVTLLLILIQASLLSIHNSNSGLHGKHPVNKIELKMRFINFMYILGRYKNPENNSEANFQQLSENVLPHSNHSRCYINTSNLNCNASLFKLVNPQQEQTTAKKELIHIHTL